MEIVALLVALVAVLAAAGNGGYLALLGRAASQRAGTAEVSRHVRGKAPVAAGAGAAALLSLVLVAGAPLLSIVLGAVGAGLATAQLQATRTRFAGR
ncbi:hypothetical protein [Rhodococcus aerolatus]